MRKSSRKSKNIRSLERLWILTRWVLEENCVEGQHGSPVSGHFPYCLRTLALCVLTALRTSSSGGQWEDLHRTDPLHWEKTFWGHKANQSSGKGCSESSRKALEETGDINWFTEVERHGDRAVVTHRRSHPFPPGYRILTLKKTFTNFIHW